MKIATLIIVGALFQLFISCQNPAQSNSLTIDNNTINQTTKQKDTGSDANLFKNVTHRKLPFRDSTNFDNYKTEDTLSNKTIDLLNIKSIVSHGNSFSFNYQLNLSDNFYTIAITYQIGEMALYTTLFTFDQNYKIIDHLNIAYDEIAESWFRQESELSNDTIVVEDISYVNEIPEIEKNTYRLEKSGKFTKL